MSKEVRNYSVITGDIVNSSKLNQKQRTLLLDTLKETFLKIDDVMPGNVVMPFEIFRGDSFQGVLEDASKGLLACLIIKIYLRKSFESTLKNAWDARLALGIGEIDFFSDKGSEGDGPAFRRSGPVLDTLKGENRMIIKTPWEDLNKEFDVSCSFLDIVTSRWSTSQAEVLIEQIDGLTQQQIADKLNISQVAVHHRMKNSGWNAVEKFIKRYEDVVNHNLKV